MYILNFFLLEKSFFFVGLFLFFFSYLIIEIMTSNFIVKKFFLNSDPREFLSMGNHQKKTTIPFFGGLIFFGSLLPLFFFSLKNPSSWLIFFSSLFSGLVGFYDDLKKLKKEKGLSVKKKFFLQAIGSFIAVLFWKLNDSSFSSKIFFGNLNFDLGIFYIFWVAFVIISTSHAINLTDGLDGLASSQSILTLLGLFYLNKFYLNNFSIYKEIFFILIPLSVFLFKNYYPAKIFMGDVGSLFLGGYISAIFLTKKLEFLLIISGGIFVLETISCILQIIWHKIFKKKLFLFAPIHHDFEKRGFSEKEIFYLFGFISVLFQIIFIFLFKNYFQKIF